MTQISAGLPQAFLANALVRVKARSRVKARLRCKGKAEKGQTLVGAVKETRNSNNRGKTGLCSTYNSRRMFFISQFILTNPNPCRQRQRHNNNSGNANMTLSDQIMQGALNARKNNPPSSSASSDGNDEAAMAVIMSLLEVSNENLTIYWLYKSCRPLRFIIPSSFSGGCWVRRSGRFQWASLAASLENGESCCIAMHWDSKCVKV